MKKKLLFFDIDGTLYNTKKVVPQSAKDAIEAARAQGHEIAIATGRSPFFLKEVSEELNIDSFVSFNGQYVVFKGEVISERPIPQDVLFRFVERAKELDLPVVFLDKERMTSTTKEDDKVLESMNSLFYPFPDYDTNRYMEQAIYQVLLYSDSEQRQIFIEEFPELAFIRWHKYSDDVINHDVSKAYGIEQFIQHTDFEMEDVIVFGDGLNDVEMLTLVAKYSTSVAMGNGEQEAKDAASIVTDHVDEDGLAKAMHKLGLTTA